MCASVNASVELAGEKEGAGAGGGWREGPGGRRLAAFETRGGRAAGETEEEGARGCRRACEGAGGRWRRAAFG